MKLNIVWLSVVLAIIGFIQFASRFAIAAEEYEPVIGDEYEYESFELKEARENIFALRATRETCRNSASQGECESFEGCEWFAELSQCIDRNLEQCWPHSQTECQQIRGCRYYVEDREYLPYNIRRNTPVRDIGCRKQTMCGLIPLAEQCRQYQYCDWVDNQCQRVGTPSNPDFSPRCFHDAQFRKTCNQIGPQCKWVSVSACNSSGCELQNYGCRNSDFCGFDQGNTVREQCISRGNCVWNGRECQRTPPTTSPTTPPPTTLSPTTQAPTPPTPAPTTEAPTPFPCGNTDNNNIKYECRNNMGGRLVPPNQNRGTTDVADFCGQLCLQYSGPTENFPLWAGCRSWSWDKSSQQCVLNNCLPGGSGLLEATVLNNNNFRSGVLGNDCFPNDDPTQSPTVSCDYTNTADPPNFTNNLVAEECVILSYQVNPEMTGSVRVRLNWCQEQCSNRIEGCTSAEFVAINTNDRRCNFLNCTTVGPRINPRVYLSNKVNPNCGV